MTDYRAVMDLVLQGWSVRQICSTVRCSHTTVQKARHTMVKRRTRSQLMHNLPASLMKKWLRDLLMVVVLLKVTSCRLTLKRLSRRAPGETK